MYRQFCGAGDRDNVLCPRRRPRRGQVSSSDALLVNFLQTIRYLENIDEVLLGVTRGVCTKVAVVRRFLRVFQRAILPYCPVIID